jgi:predicted nucleic acid-binding protein
MYFSAPVMAEYEDVLRRPRLDIHPEKETNALAGIREAGLAVTPTIPVTAASDPDDNIFLECAQAAEAHYLVTGNVKDFPCEWQMTRIVTAREFVELVADALREPG